MLQNTSLLRLPGEKLVCNIHFDIVVQNTSKLLSFFAFFVDIFIWASNIWIAGSRRKRSCKRNLTIFRSFIRIEKYPSWTILKTRATLPQTVLQFQWCLRVGKFERNQETRDCRITDMRSICRPAIEVTFIVGASIEVSAGAGSFTTWRSFRLISW